MEELQVRWGSFHVGEETVVKYERDVLLVEELPQFVVFAVCHDGVQNI